MQHVAKKKPTNYEDVEAICRRIKSAAQLCRTLLSLISNPHLKISAQHSDVVYVVHDEEQTNCLHLILRNQLSILKTQMLADAHTLHDNLGLGDFE